MFITTYAVFSLETSELLRREGFDYVGPLVLCKGDSTASSSESTTAAFQKTLTAAFQTQFAKQAGVLNFLNGKLTGNINNPQGFNPNTLAALNSQAIEGTGSQYQNALKTEQAQAATHDSGLPSGVDAQIKGQLAGAAAGETSSALNNIQIQNGQLQNQNYWRSVDALNGVASEENPLGYASGATSAGGTVANLSGAVNASNQSQLLGALGGVVGGGAQAFGAYEGAH